MLRAHRYDHLSMIISQPKRRRKESFEEYVREPLANITNKDITSFLQAAEKRTRFISKKVDMTDEDDPDEPFSSAKKLDFSDKSPQMQKV